VFKGRRITAVTPARGLSPLALAAVACACVALAGPTAVASASTATFGKTTVGATAQSDPANLKGVSKYALPAAGSLSKLSLYLQPTGTSGQQSLQGVIYAEAAGAPGALLASTNRLTFVSTNTAGWYELALPAALKLAAGNYWIGFISGATTGVAAFRYDTVASALDYNSNAYTSGPSNPFGTPTVLSESISLYATYTPAPSSSSRPSDITLPSIPASPQTNQKLSAGPGTWSEEPTSYAYHWQRCSSPSSCSAITGATESSYTPSSLDVGFTLRVEVIATNNNGPSEAAFSPQSAAVTAATSHTYYVSDQGEEQTADGTLEKPWRTIKRVNEGANGVNGEFPAGSTILFEAGYKPEEKEANTYLEGNSGGNESEPITYSTYGGSSDADVVDIYVMSHSFLRFDHMSMIGPSIEKVPCDQEPKELCEYAAGGEHANNITIENSEIKHWTIGISVRYGNNWHIIGDTIEETGNSGILTQTDAEIEPPSQKELAEGKEGKEEPGHPPGEGWVIDDSTVNRTGLISNICGTAARFCHEHGIYCRCRNSEISDNTITNFSDAGITQRYGNDTIKGNKISKGGETGETGSQGISFFPYDSKETTSRWVENEISNVPVGMYVADFDEGSGDKYVKEHFIIDDNKFKEDGTPAKSEAELIEYVAGGRTEFLTEHKGNTFE